MIHKYRLQIIWLIHKNITLENSCSWGSTLNLPIKNPCLWSLVHLGSSQRRCFYLLNFLHLDYFQVFQHFLQRKINSKMILIIKEISNILNSRFGQFQLLHLSSHTLLLHHPSTYRYGQRIYPKSQRLNLLYYLGLLLSAYLTCHRSLQRPSKSWLREVEVFKFCAKM